ncbi:sensor histidine kinase [Dyella sp. Tek66A03]|uniref:sensor histidine kinase n=1 Tax=Dyella sp. Tek66A03 TaxID=3458298 RepID=UPI00403E914D
MLFAMLGAGGVARAVDPSRLLSQYGHTGWRLQDGELPAPAYPLAQTADGYLWIGTQAGVVRYDGARFVPLDTLTKSRLRNPFILALLGAKDGSLWIGTPAGLSRWKNGKLTDYGGVDGSVFSLAEDDNGKVWLLTIGKDSKPLCEVAGSGVTCHGKEDGLEALGIFCDRMITDGKGTFWMGTDTSVVEWHQHALSKSFPIEAKIKAGTPGALVLAREPTGEIWAGLPMTGTGLGLQRLVGGQWQPFQTPALAGSSLAVQSMFRDHAGALWIGTIDHGIYRIDSGRVDHFDRKDGLTSDNIYSFFEDREGNMWVTTSAGLDRFRDFRVWSYTTQEGLAVDEVDSVLAGRDGRIWAGTASGLDVLDHGKFHSLRSGKELPGTQVTALFEDLAGRVWVGIDEGLWVYAAGKFSVVLDQHGKALKGMAFALAQDAEGDVWTQLRGHPSKLLRIRNEHVVEEFDAPQFPQVRSLASDRDGGIWLGLQHGDLARPGASGQQVSTHLDTPVLDIVVANDGLVLGATGKGLIVFKNGALRILSAKDGLPCDAVHGLVDGEDGSLWLSMSCGLAEVKLADVEEALRHPAHTIGVDVFDVLDGVRPGLAPFQRKAARAPNGSLWFANGVVLQSFDPQANVATGGALPIHIESLTADRKLYPVADDLALPALTHDVQFDYTATGLAVPQHLRFRYRLDGRDQDWVEAGQRRQAFYTDLPPGTYRFRVAASTGNGGWEETPTPLVFSVKAAFYQTGLFMLLVVALVALALWMLFAWRLAYIKAQMRTIFEERHAERERIARELHDTFLQAVQGLMLRFQSAMERIPATQPARDLMERALDHADEVIIEGRDRLTNLRTLEQQEANLERSLQQMGEEFARDTRITFRLTVEGMPRSLDPAAGDEVLRVAQEVMANAFRHAQASRIDVSLAYGRKHLTLSIVDDGIGFDADAVARYGPAGHWGMKGLHERAASLRARLTLSSRPGIGTALELAVPASIAFRRPLNRWRRRLELVRLVFPGRGSKARSFDGQDE